MMKENRIPNRSVSNRIASLFNRFCFVVYFYCRNLFRIFFAKQKFYLYVFRMSGRELLHHHKFSQWNISRLWWDCQEVNIITLSDDMTNVLALLILFIYFSFSGKKKKKRSAESINWWLVTYNSILIFILLRTPYDATIDI